MKKSDELENLIEKVREMLQSEFATPVQRSSCFLSMQLPNGKFYNVLVFEDTTDKNYAETCEKKLREKIAKS